jgi:xylulokinase
MGAAVTGGVGVGIFKDFEVINNFIRIDDIQEPIEINNAKYNQLSPIFDDCYFSLVEVYEKLAALK